MIILSKGCKPDKFESHNSIKLRFTSIGGLHLNFFDCESFLESNSPDVLALCEKKLDDSIGYGKIYVRGYLPLIQKYSITHMPGSATLLETPGHFSSSGKLLESPGFWKRMANSLGNLLEFSDLYVSEICFRRFYCRSNVVCFFFECV